MPKVVIVGAGISGLALAYRLTKLLPQAEIAVLEERSRPGGTAWTERLQGFQVEIGPNGFLDTKPSTMNLCRELGLEDRLIPASEVSSRSRFLFVDGKLQALPRGIVSFLRSDILSWRGKAALLAEPFRRRKRNPIEESIDAFARRRFGREAAETLVDAIVTGVHAGDPVLLGARATFPRLVAFEEQYGSVLRGFLRAAKQRRDEKAAESRSRSKSSSMWSFREGVRVLIETLASALPTEPVFGVRVQRLLRQRPDGLPGWTVYGEGNASWTADAVILTCPAHRQAEILEGYDEILAGWVANILYNRVAVVALGFKQADIPMSLDGFGFIAPQRTRRDLLGVQWCSSIFPDRSPPGTVLLRAMCGGWNRPEILDWGDDRLLRAVHTELQTAMKITSAPIFDSIVRWDKAIPQYHVGHLDHTARIQLRTGMHPGLFLGGNGYFGVALNDCTEQAEVLAEKVRSYLARCSGGSGC
jgi:protoporphyrinogen/coproporphyrinogen III oxidase